MWSLFTDWNHEQEREREREATLAAIICLSIEPGGIKRL